MLKITCDFCGKEDEIRILPSFVVLAKSLATVSEQVEKAVAAGTTDQKHELLVPTGWVTAPKAIPCDNSAARAWVACSMEHGIQLEDQQRAMGQWTDPEGKMPIEHVCEAAEELLKPYKPPWEVQ